MEPSGRNSTAAGRLLASAVADPAGVDDSTVGCAVDLLGSDEKRARVTAAYVLGLAADAAPEQVLPAVTAIAPLLAEAETRPDAERALAYLGRTRPRELEGEIAALSDEGTRRRCREAIWGVGAPRTVVELETDEPDPDAPLLADATVNDPYWGWAGGSAATYGSRTDEERWSGPPTERPVEPRSVDHPLDAYEPVATLHEGEVVDVLKVLYPGADGETDAAALLRFRVPPTDGFLEDFEYRVSLWDSLADHGHVLPVVDHGTDPGAWLAVEHVVGRGVRGLAGSVGVDAAAWVCSRVADALCHAHKRGVTHGAVTPGAVVLSELLVEPGSWPFPRVTDWGLLELLVDHGVDTAIPKRYAAPEHLAPATFGDVDDATDVFGFGVTAYTALAGRSPFDGHRDATEDAVREADWPPITDVDPSLPTALDDVLAKCLAARKAERYETVQAMRAEFRDEVGDLR